MTTESLPAFDLRLRSLEGDEYSACNCGLQATWSVWLHTPEWGSGLAGETRVTCFGCGLGLLASAARTSTG